MHGFIKKFTPKKPGINTGNIVLPFTKLFIYPVMIFLGVLSALPVYLVLVNITRSTAEINSGISLIPSVHLVDNWRILNSTGLSLTRGFFNSFFIASVTSVCTTYASAMVAYGIYLYQFRGRDVSRIQGSGEFRTFNAIIIPIMKPALALQAFFIFVGSWNNFMLPYMLLSDRKLFTVPMMAALLQADIHNVEFGSVYLGIAVSFIPAICVYTVMSRFIISGLTSGSLKE